MGRAFLDRRRAATARPRPCGRYAMAIAAGLCLMLLGCAAPAGGTSFAGPYGGITGGTGGAYGR